ncbi:glycoside hydrolase family 31 protein [Suillus paluster]|uniref:glycoside hydrolase family 31 protein n=1 Tax=Suillus paluster TaxID=48578 RepID=UPI001B861B75|nr:glycoside hydrolase family 31 protein [Suillus paluster]KAG1729210.1 glycoside hydrolase family 31 protein [Suillus paluster]
MRSLGFSGTFVLLLLLPTALAFKASDFKTCSQSGFCRRGRALAARAQESPSSWHSPYSIEPPSSLLLNPRQPGFTTDVKSSIYPSVKFTLDVIIHEDGVVRTRMNEVDGLRKRYDEAAQWALVQEPLLSEDVLWTVGKKNVKAVYGPKKDMELVVDFNPLKITLFRGGKEQVVLNGRGLLHMEHFRSKEDSTLEEGEGQTVLQVNPAVWFEGDTQDAWWDETFSSWTDTKPKGPESLSLDITFPNHAHVYGIPQHATNLSLPSTTGPNAQYTDPFRLYNADVFEYLSDSPVSLYGSIPLMHAHSAQSTVAIFNALASETWIDIAHTPKKGVETHWISESGILDVFLIPGPTPEDVFKQYARLTGTAPLPAHWALGYHQCRWNYVSSDDVRGVQTRFDEENFPVDVFWLDIEYAEDHRYFMWNKKTFPDPVEMTRDVEAVERKMVVIIDPHLKRANDYPVYKRASELGVLVKPKSGEGEYEGWCWPGSSSWIDFFHPGSWDFWISLFKTKSINGQWSWTESTDNVGIWNDMNEPSVFNGPEITMPKDNVHYGGWEHRDVHNINGMLFANHTFQAAEARTDPLRRPFVLTRAFYAGSQRFGAMWTGDNLGTWEHMAVGIKMVLANGVGGMPFAGSDVGGFFGNPEPEMLVRWYVVGAFSPFFRAHAHIDTKRREPYLLEEPYKSLVRDILRLRYSMLPVWYTAFRETSESGVPILRPQYMVFPGDEAGFGIDDQYYIGSSGLLVKPVTQKGVKEVSVYIAEDQVYYDYFTHNAHHGSPKGRHITLPANLHQIPLLIRGGSIISTRERPRRSSPLMKNDPFTLRVALDNIGNARGEVYVDDGETYGYVGGDVVWRQFVAESVKEKGKKKGGKAVRISSSDLAAGPGASEGSEVAAYSPGNEFARSVGDVRIEKVVMMGLGKKPSSVVLEGGRELEWEYTPGVGSDGEEGEAGVLVVKDPAVRLVEDWVVVVKLE